MTKPFVVYFIPIAHHDLGYTHTIDVLLKEYCKYYDDVIKFCEMTDNYPYEAQYRYSVEQFWSLDYYLKHTSEYNIERLKKYIRQGRIELPALYANVIDGLCSGEQLARLMYPSFEFAKEAGIQIKTASLTDIPGMCDGTIQALYSAGIKYLFAGFPQYFRWLDCSGNKLQMQHSYWDENVVEWRYPAAFKWRSIAGGEVFVWYQDGYGWFGDDNNPIVEHDSYEDIEKHLPRFVAQLKAKGTPYNLMRYIYHGSDNQAPQFGISDIAKRWNEEHDDIKLVVATNTMFFEALGSELAESNLPIIRGELPHTDYTILSLSESEMTALNAYTKTRALNAEKLLALMGVNSTKQLCDIFKSATLYDEHCFGMAISHGYNNEFNRTFKIAYALDAARKTDILYKTAQNAVQPNEGIYTLFSPFGGKSISSVLSENDLFGCTGNNSVLTNNRNETIIVQRDEVDSPLLPVYGISDRYAMRQPKNKLYEYTIYSESDSMSIDRFRVNDGITEDSRCQNPVDILENDFYKLEFDNENCYIKDIYDKEIGMFVTDGNPFGTVISHDIQTGRIYAPTGKYLQHRKHGLVADSILICSETYSAPQIITEITLYHKIKRIDFAYRIMLNRTPLRELFIHFPFKVNSPSFSYQGSGARISAFDDIVPGANTNQYTVGDYCIINGNECDIILASTQAKIFEFGGLYPTAVSQAHHWLNPIGYTEQFIKKEDITSADVYSMIAYNNCRTNFPATQQGEAIYSFSFTSGKNINADKFSCCALYPNVLLEGSFKRTAIDIGSDYILPVCFKAAEDGDGYILRLREVGNRDRIFSLKTEGMTIREAFICTLNEEMQDKADCDSLKIGAYQTLTIKIKLIE
ncbi:MAG: glycosyl hydrolase-related protein [Eubacteriales bacterium]|jgi:alpha-mannosidase